MAELSIWRVDALIHNPSRGDTFWADQVELVASTADDAKQAAYGFLDDHLADITPDPAAVITIGEAKPYEVPNRARP